MKPWIKSFSPHDPILKPIMKNFGYEGYGKFISIMEFCNNYDIEYIDAQTIMRQTGGNIRTALRLLPIFQETLPKVWVKLGKSFGRVSVEFDESFSKLEVVKHCESNNSIKETESYLEEEEEKQKENQALNQKEKECVSDVFKKNELTDWASESYQSVLGSHPTLSTWKEGAINIFNRISNESPLDASIKKSAWSRTLEKAICSKIHGLRWFETVYVAQLNEPPKAEVTTKKQSSVPNFNDVKYDKAKQWLDSGGFKYHGNVMNPGDFRLGVSPGALYWKEPPFGEDSIPIVFITPLDDSGGVRDEPPVNIESIAIVQDSQPEKKVVASGRSREECLRIIQEQIHKEKIGGSL